MFFEVIPTEVFRTGAGTLTYSSNLKLQPGHLVLIPLGRRIITGIVLRRVKSVDFPTKPIKKLLLTTPIPPHLVKSALWLADFYLTPLPQTANLMLPAGLAAKTALKSFPSLDPANSPLYMPNDPKTTSSTSRKTTKTLTEAASSPSRPFSSKTAIKQPLKSKNAQIAPQGPNTPNLLKLPLIPLNFAQKNALQALQEPSQGTKLLRGVTGSGKTNIYLKMTADALKTQKSTILLVPEIALTSQLIRIFTETFGDRVVLIHSQHAMTERRRIWLDILQRTSTANNAEPEPLIIIGPRSALLTPVNNLGLILIDEAHESAYYQENAPRYSAIRLASFMANQCKILCINGTATPNIVDFHLAKSHHALVELSTKAKTTAIEPEISVVDLCNRDNFRQNRYFSDQLLTKIKNNLQANHQTLIFHNRRGSAPMTICEDCGWQALCPNCYIPMNLHSDTYQLTCHLCGHEVKVPSSCPNCHHTSIMHKGFGTKLLETELATLFPKAKIARFDGDNKKTGSLAELYQTVKSGEINILIGTQTLARGLDLPHLATVGVVQADAGLSLPDFAAEERCFELLTQVIGRVGRGHLDTASVIIQTYQPNHPVIQTALTADFPKFATYELRQRRTGNLPPFTYLARLTITYKTEKTVFAKIQQAYNILTKDPKLQVSPPMPAFHERVSRGFTWQLIIKSTSRAALRQALQSFAKYHLELDPPSVL